MFKSNTKTRHARSSRPVPYGSAAEAVVRPLTPPLEDQATCFVMSRFVQSLPGSHGYLIYLPSLCGDQHNCGALSDVVVCLGMATMANKRQSAALMLAARRRLAIALAHTNAALQDPIRAKTDQTLLAVILLTLYEVVSDKQGWFPLTQRQDCNGCHSAIGQGVDGAHRRQHSPAEASWTRAVPARGRAQDVLEHLPADREVLDMPNRPALTKRASSLAVSRDRLLYPRRCENGVQGCGQCNRPSSVTLTVW